MTEDELLNMPNEDDLEDALLAAAMGHYDDDVAAMKAHLTSDDAADMTWPTASAASITGIISPDGMITFDDKPAQPVRQPMLSWSGKREDVIRAMHREVVIMLTNTRARRDALNDEIRELAEEESRLARIVGILDGKRIHRPKAATDAETDAS